MSSLVLRQYCSESALPGARPWICAASGAAFYIYFSLTTVGGWPGALCIGIFAWEAWLSRFYRVSSLVCILGVAASLAILAAFKYWYFVVHLLFEPIGYGSLGWSGAFLPLGISFFTFEFIHYAVDRYRGRVERGTTDSCAAIAVARIPA